MGDTFKFKDSAGVEHAYKYQKHHEFELGSMFFGENIGFEIDSEYSDLCQNAFRVISRLRFDDAEMRKQFAPQMPVDFMFYDRNVVCPNLNKDILLKDLIEYHDIPPEHIAWIISRLLNIRCYLQHIGITHNCIDVNTVSVNPSNHWVWLFGGWWYARPLSLIHI